MVVCTYGSVDWLSGFAAFIHGQNCSPERFNFSWSSVFINFHVCRTATHCNTLQHTATHGNAHCITLQHTLQHTDLCTFSWSSVLIYFHVCRTATHCNTLQHTATHTASHCNAHCNTQTCALSLGVLFWLTFMCAALQHTTTHCNTLQRTLHHNATHTASLCNPHCITLQRTLQHTDLCTFSCSSVFSTSIRAVHFFSLSIVWFKTDSLACTSWKNKGGGKKKWSPSNWKLCCMHVLKNKDLKITQTNPLHCYDILIRKEAVPNKTRTPLIM